MTIKLKEKANLLSTQVNLRMEIRISYLMFRLGLEPCCKDNKKIADFYNFCENFFYIWERHLNRISPLVNEFNMVESTKDSKKIYAEIISEQYRKYLQSLQKMEVPVYLKESFKLLLDYVNEKQKYFMFHSDNSIYEETNKIENEDDEREYKLWYDLSEKNKQIENLHKNFDS